MRVASVDPGKEGAACLHDTAVGGFEFFDMPLNEDREHDTIKLFHKLLEFEPDVVVAERVIRPVVLVMHLGEICCLSKVLQAQLFLVAPNTWKSKVIGQVTSDKKKSIDRALQLEPSLQLIKPRCRTPSHDRAESFLMLQWYLMTNGLAGKTP